MGGLSHLSSHNIAFRTWIHQVGLVDLGHHGAVYTWSNKKKGREAICERLDRAMSNLSWVLHNPKTAIYHLPRFSSDHLPILVRVNPIKATRKGGFRTENWWLMAEGFKQVCDKVTEEGSASWSQVIGVFKREVRKWVRVQKSPNQLLSEIEKEML